MAEVTDVTTLHVQKISVTAPEQAEIWNLVHGVGTPVPASGIYRCTGCGDEIASNKGDKFPPQDHHQHPWIGTEKTWQLIVKTRTK